MLSNIFEMFWEYVLTSYCQDLKIWELFLFKLIYKIILKKCNNLKVTLDASSCKCDWYGIF